MNALRQRHQTESLSDEHFNTHPNDVSWGDVGTLQHTAARLREITERARAS